MALTAKKAYAVGMGPFPAGIFRAPYPYVYRAPKGYTEEEAIQYYIDELQRIFDEGAPAGEIACMIVEPFQGEGGFIPAPIEWVKAVRKICDDNGILMIADEVQCGNCRTGKYYASEYWAEAGAAPDIITTAKSLGAGLPISAITARAEIMDAAPAGTIGGTFCGNPVSCAAALAVMDVMKRDDYAGKARHIGETVMKRYKELQEKYPVIGDVRGLGAMIGIELVKDKETKEPATVRALKYNGGVAKADLNNENLEALEKGIPNLLKHVSNIKNVYKLPCVVAINAFPTDTKAELDFVEAKCKELGVNVALSEVWAKGGEGGIKLAEEVIRLVEEPNDFTYAYELEGSIEDKLNQIVQKVYGGKKVVLTANAQQPFLLS
jgi:4-aminobutyrate aminotransferase-like enzyme